MGELPFLKIAPRIIQSQINSGKDRECLVGESGLGESERGAVSSFNATQPPLFGVVTARPELEMSSRLNPLCYVRPSRPDDSIEYPETAIKM